MLHNNFVRIAIGTAVLMLIPLYLTITGSGVDGVGWHWTLGDFIFMYVLVAGAATLFELARRKAAGNSTYTWAAGLAFAGLFLLVWINGAVGIIGDSDINMLYAAVPLTLVLGTIISRLKASGMSVTLFATALVQALIPVIAYAIHTPGFSPGVLEVIILNGFFVAVFAGSALLFRKASPHQSLRAA
jgi:hypothetical protein